MRRLLTGGTVVTLDPTIGTLPRGDVLIVDGVIEAVAERIEDRDAERGDATDRVVMPGFVDVHRHTWQTAFRGVGADWTFEQYLVGAHLTLKPHYTPEDVYVSTLLGRLEALHCGVTTMLDCSTAPRRPNTPTPRSLPWQRRPAGRSSATAPAGAPPTGSTTRSAACVPPCRPVLFSPWPWGCADHS